jgi:hypothetical protein
MALHTSLRRCVAYHRLPGNFPAPLMVLSCPRGHSRRAIRSSQARHNQRNRHIERPSSTGTSLEDASPGQPQAQKSNRRHCAKSIDNDGGQSEAMHKLSSAQGSMRQADSMRKLWQIEYTMYLRRAVGRRRLRSTGTGQAYDNSPVRPSVRTGANG